MGFGTKCRLGIWPKKKKEKQKIFRPLSESLPRFTIKIEKEEGKDEILNHRPITATAQAIDHATGESTIATKATGTKSISQILVIQNNKTKR